MLAGGHRDADSTDLLCIYAIFPRRRQRNSKSTHYAVDKNVPLSDSASGTKDGTKAIWVAVI
jgi:hypothetical protein